jgi:hypothetical protein
MRTVFTMIVILFLISCGKESCRQDSPMSQEVNITVERLETTIFESKSEEDVENFLNENVQFAALFLDSEEYPDKSILAQKIFKLVDDPFIDTLYNEATAEYDDFDEIKLTLNDAIGRMKTLFPEMTIPKIQTAVTGLYKDLYISDTLVIIGLDFFIGEKATYKPMDIPAYILEKYDRENLPVTIVKFLSGGYVSKGKKETLLSEMVDFGKTYYLLSRLMPCTPDSLIIGYSPKEMVTIEKNQANIWANFVENEILYETSHITKRKFLGERPNVYEISRECPGRIGAWIGWQIVEAYMATNDVTILELISERDNDKIFQKSGYKPKN